MGRNGPRPCCSANMIIASIIIVTKNQKDFLEKTIPVLLSQKVKEDFEIIIVDSGSKDGAKEYVQKIKSIKLVSITPENFKFANAFNTGAREAKGKYLVRLSGDCTPIGTQWLNEIIKGFEDDLVGGVYGKYVISGRKGYAYPNFWPAWRFPNKKVRHSVKPYPFAANVFDFAGGCCAIRRDIWKQRPFNEKLIAGEDAEYSWFLHVIGYDVVYNPNIKVLHEHKVDPVASARTYSGLEKWNLVFGWEISKYWIKRCFGNDPYRRFNRS
jgi:rhamnosyltransferase